MAFQKLLNLGDSSLFVAFALINLRHEQIERRVIVIHVNLRGLEGVFLGLLKIVHVEVGRGPVKKA